jgi:hypothetical protein
VRAPYMSLSHTSCVRAMPVCVCTWALNDHRSSVGSLVPNRMVGHWKTDTCTMRVPKHDTKAFISGIL